MRANEQKQFNALHIASMTLAQACQFCPYQESRKHHLCATCEVYKQHDATLTAQQRLANTGRVDFMTSEGWAG